MPAPPASRAAPAMSPAAPAPDRKSTRLNSSHLGISYAVFCLTPCPPRPTLFPYTTLFRSRGRTPHVLVDLVDDGASRRRHEVLERVDDGNNPVAAVADKLAHAGSSGE